MFFKRKKKQLPPAAAPAKDQLPPKASAKTKAAIAFFNDKKPATDLLEVERQKKFVHSGYTKTKVDHFFEWVEAQPWGKWAVFALATAFVVAVAYWGIKQ